MLVKLGWTRTVDSFWGRTNRGTRSSFRTFKKSLDFRKDVVGRNVDICSKKWVTLLKMTVETLAVASK